jgi:hypothetical protein
MKTKNIIIVIAVLVAAGAILIGTTQAQNNASERATMDDSAMTAENVRVMIAGWPQASRDAATTTIAKYGQPDEMTPSMLIWYDNGPWKKTIVFREEVPHEFPAAHTDVLQQFIDYKVPVEKFDDLASYDGSVIVERTKGEMSARCDKEELNMLALNLANDVAIGTRTVEDARTYYAQAAMKFKSGQTDPYLTELRFSPQTDAADPDMMASEPAMMQQ